MTLNTRTPSEGNTPACLPASTESAATENHSASPDATQIRRMVELIHAAAAGTTGSLVLACIADNPRSRRDFFEFGVGDVDGMVAKALELAAIPGSNVYWANMVMQEGVTRNRSWRSPDHCGPVIALVIDDDADRGMNGSVPFPPSVTLLTSQDPAKNRQHVYFYAGEERPSYSEAKLQGEALRKLAGADPAATGRVPHLYRMAGTLNWPTRTKLARNRPPTPQPVIIECGDGFAIDVQAFAASLDTSSVEAPPMSEPTSSTLEVVKRLPARVLPLLERHDINGDRSPAAFAALKELIGHGLSNQEIASVVLGYPTGVGERYVNDGKSLTDDIRRAREKTTSASPVKIASTEDRAEDQSDISTPYWRHRDGRLFFDVELKDKILQIPLCTPLRIIGRARDAGGGNWANVIDVHSPDGEWRRVLIPEADLYVTSGEREVVQTLAQEGLRLFRAGHKCELRTLILTSPASGKARTVRQPGWTADGFALPTRFIGASCQDNFIWSGEARDVDAFTQRETLEEWVHNVAQPAVEHPALLTVLCMALTGPLLGALDKSDGFGIHLHGASSSGKTTAIEVAASVWGPPERFVKPWRGTDNGIEAVAASRNHTLLPLDELNQVDPRVAHHCAYMLAQGQGKSRMTKTTALRKNATWIAPILSTGEESFADYLKRGPNGRAKAGQAVRMLDIPVPIAEEDKGVFRGGGSAADFAATAAALKSAARTFHGTAGVRYIEALANSRSQLRNTVKKAQGIWRTIATKKLGAANLDGQVHRVIDHLGYLFTAGVLAAQMGLLPTTPTKIAMALIDVLLAWIAKRGGAGALEERQAIEAVRKFLGENAARFTPRDGVPPHNRAGGIYVETPRGYNQQYFAILPSVFRDEICAGLDCRFVLRVLKDKGWLHHDKAKLTRKVTIGGGDRERPLCYCVSAEILEAE